MNNIKSYKQLISFFRFCIEHPYLRFWQALRDWSKSNYILKAECYDIDKDTAYRIRDTFYEV